MADEDAAMGEVSVIDDIMATFLLNDRRTANASPTEA
jgi:hypothetical protein